MSPLFSSKLQSLTRQQQQIHDLQLKGYTNKEIAGKLFICLSTVNKHSQNILAKLRWVESLNTGAQ